MLSSAHSPTVLPVQNQARGPCHTTLCLCGARRSMGITAPGLSWLCWPRYAHREELLCAGQSASDSFPMNCTVWPYFHLGFPRDAKDLFQAGKPPASAGNTRFKVNRNLRACAPYAAKIPQEGGESEGFLPLKHKCAGAEELDELPLACAMGWGRELGSAPRTALPA